MTRAAGEEQAMTGLSMPSRMYGYNRVPTTASRAGRDGRNLHGALNRSIIAVPFTGRRARKEKRRARAERKRGRMRGRGQPVMMAMASVAGGIWC